MLWVTIRNDFVMKQGVIYVFCRGQQDKQLLIRHFGQIIDQYFYEIGDIMQSIYPLCIEWKYQYINILHTYSIKYSSTSNHSVIFIT